MSGRDRASTSMDTGAAEEGEAERMVEYEPRPLDEFDPPAKEMFKQILMSAVCIGICTGILLLTAREVAEGRRWHEYSLLAAKRLSEDHSQLQPLLYTPGVELRRSLEPGDTHRLPPEHAKPIEHWLSGVGGASQAQQATYDVHPETNPALRVQLPGRPAGDGNVSDSTLTLLDFRSSAAEAKARARVEADAIRRGPAAPAKQVEVKTALTSKSFAKWSHCGARFHNQKVYSTSIMQVIENKELGTAPFVAAKAFATLNKLGCVFFTKNCIQQNKPELITETKSQVFTTKMFKTVVPPALPRGSLGSCAVVGHSDRLLGQNLGFEIDNHTTVVRLGYYVHAPTRRGGKVVDSPSAPPLAGFEAATGNRTDFVWLPKRRVYTSKSIPVDSRTHMWATPEWKVFPRVKTLAGRGRYAKFIQGVEDHIYSAFDKTKLRAKVGHASDELEAVLWWAASGLCSQIDVYGLPLPQAGGRGSRAYWATTIYDPAEKQPWPGPTVPMANVNLEMYALHAAMRAGLLCVRTH